MLFSEGQQKESSYVGRVCVGLGFRVLDHIVLFKTSFGGAFFHSLGDIGGTLVIFFKHILLSFFGVLMG
jgi:hypothetical protein